MIVCCMLSINKLLCDLFQQLALEPHLYADNWAYWTHQPSEHSAAISVIQEIAEALKLTIDWNKSSCWSTSEEHRQAFVVATRDIPQLPQIPAVTHAKDLGATFHYRSHQLRQPQRERHELTLHKLTKL